MTTPTTTSKTTTTTTTKDKFRACLLLSVVGDAIGFNNSRWEFQRAGRLIHEEFDSLTKGKGTAGLEVDLKWRYSDDTVLHLATASALVQAGPRASLTTRMEATARAYKDGMKDMSGRAPGKSTVKVLVHVLDDEGKNWNRVPHNTRSGGCGAAMRMACVGCLFHREDQLDALIQVSVEAARVTHHFCVGYLGAVAVALFAALAIRGVPLPEWGRIWLETLPAIEAYIRAAGREVEANLRGWDVPHKQWIRYLKSRGLLADGGDSEDKGGAGAGAGAGAEADTPVADAADAADAADVAADDAPRPPLVPHFPEPYDVMAREHFFKEQSLRGIGGAGGTDCAIIAYDGLLFADGNWERLVRHSVLHGGDNDSTGAVACALFGCLYGFDGVPAANYRSVEGKERALKLANKLWALHKAESTPTTASKT